MLFPAEDEYVAWFERAGFERDRARARRARLVGRALGPLRGGDRRRQAARGRAAARWRAAAAAAEDARAPLPVRLARFAAGSLAGAAFIPVALWFTLVRRLRRSG